MIRTDFYMTRPDGVNLYRTYSDANLRIRQETGIVYDEAVDVENSGHTYTETDEPVIGEELTDTAALNVIMGRGIINEPDDGGTVPEED